jgi:hypothetical protein
MVTFLLQIAFVAAVIFTMLAGLLALGNILPTAAIASAITLAGSYLAVIYEFLPYTVSEILLLFGFLLTVEYYIVVYKMLKFIWKKIPGVT